MKKVIYIVIAVILLGGIFYYKNAIMGRAAMSRTQVPVASAEGNRLGNPETKNGQKVLVAYFSWGGNTRKVANQIHEAVGGDIFEIRTATPYPAEYEPTTKVAKEEIEKDIRPALAGEIDDMSDYDVVFIGYPIWWHTAPMVVHTFMESYDLSGKTVIPFCTSGGSDLQESLPAIRQLAPHSKILEGLTANDHSAIEPWLKKIGILK